MTPEEAFVDKPVLDVTRPSTHPEPRMRVTGSGHRDRVWSWGDVDAPQQGEFKDVVRPHLPWLYGLACRLAGDQAEDAVQECLIKAFRSYDRLRDEQALPAWLRQILVNVIRDMARHDARHVEEVPVEHVDDESYSLYRKIADEDPLPYSDAVHLDFLSCFTVPDVWAVLDQLPAHYRTPLVLVHMYGVPAREVATALGLPQGTLLSRLHRGRKRFEKSLWDYAQEHGLLREMEGALP